MKILFIRHGQSKANAGIQPEGKDDPQVELTELGHKQAYECGNKLGEEYESETYALPIYVSPYVRARQTFDGIKKGILDTTCYKSEDIKAFSDFRLREIYLNDEHKNHSEIREFFKNKYSGDVDKYNFMHVSIPGGETCSKLMDRTHSFLDYISREVECEIEKFNGVIIVGHSISYAAMRAISEAKNIPNVCIYERFMYWATEGRIKNCEIVKFDY